jgi:hypothetical protein
VIALKGGEDDKSSSMQLRLSDEQFSPNGVQRSSGSLMKTSSPQSQIHVIDTAIVRSTTDTTRHLSVFNTLGQQVSQLVNGDVEAGYHEVRFDGSELASGVYLCRMVAGSYVETRKLLLVR